MCEMYDEVATDVRLATDWTMALIGAGDYCPVH